MYSVFFPHLTPRYSYAPRLGMEMMSVLLESQMTRRNDGLGSGPYICLACDVEHRQDRQGHPNVIRQPCTPHGRAVSWHHRERQPRELSTLELDALHAPNVACGITAAYPPHCARHGDRGFSRVSAAAAGLAAVGSCMGETLPLLVHLHCPACRARSFLRKSLDFPTL